MDEELRARERRATVDAEPAARERWEAEQERQGRFERIDLPFAFRVHLEGRRVDGPTGRPLRIPRGALALFSPLVGEAEVSEALGEAAQSGRVPGIILHSLTPESAERLRGAPLRALTLMLDSRPLRFDLAAWLATLTRLEYLHISSSRVTPRDIVPALGSLPRLRDLNLSSWLDAPLGEALAALPALERLSLSVRPADLPRLAPLLDRPLRALSLTTDAEPPLGPLLQLRGREELEELQLVGFAAPGQVELYSSLPSLESLDLKAPIADLGAFACAPRLRRLSLRSEAATALEALAPGACLEHLELLCPVTGRWSALAHLPLEVLRWVTDDPQAAAQARGLAGLSRLRTLHLTLGPEALSAALRATASWRELERMTCSTRGTLPAVAIAALCERPPLRSLQPGFVADPADARAIIAAHPDAIGADLIPPSSALSVSGEERQRLREGRDIELIASRCPDDPASFARAANALGQQGEHEAARRCEEVAYASQPHLTRAIRLVERQLRCGDVAAAAALAERHPRLPLPLRAELALARGELGRARALAREALDDASSQSWQLLPGREIHNVLRRLREIEDLPDPSGASEA